MTVQSRKIKRIIIGAVAVLAVMILGAVAIKQSAPSKTSTLAGLDATVYRSATCGCCAQYISYLRRAGIKVEEKIETDMPSIKKRYSVPDSLTSCHTTEIGGYTVEGHIPVEGIEKLMAEKPTVAGIGLGGMPAGSPGMPGAKQGPFEIISFDQNGGTAAFMSI